MVALALCSALRCAALREVSYVLNALIEKSQSVDGDRETEMERRRAEDSQMRHAEIWMKRPEVCARRA